MSKFSTQYSVVSHPGDVGCDRQDEAWRIAYRSRARQFSRQVQNHYPVLGTLAPSCFRSANRMTCCCANCRKKFLMFVILRPSALCEAEGPGVRLCRNRSHPHHH